MSADQLRFDKMKNPHSTQFVVTPHAFPRESSVFIEYDTVKLPKREHERGRFLIEERRTLERILSALGIEQPAMTLHGDVHMTSEHSGIFATIPTTKLGQFAKAIAKNRIPDAVPADSAPFMTSHHRKKQTGNGLASGL